MNVAGKPLWLEGMFLRPQHLQQYDRWIETTLERRIAGLFGYSWGIRSLDFDSDALANGQIRLAEIEAVFPDGTVYSAPAGQPLPQARRIAPENQGKTVFLALPLRAPGGAEVAETDADGRRFRMTTATVRDTAQTDRPAADIVVGALNVRLVIEGEALDELVLIPIAEIEAVDAQGQITLSSSFIPPVLVTAASPRLLSVMEQIRALLRTRANVLASGAMGEAGGTRAGLLDLMTLGITNRFEAIFTHLVASGLNTPEAVYRECIALIGELSAYAATGRRPPDLPPYLHTDLRATFDRLMPPLRDLLSVIVERDAVNIPLTEREYGIWLGEIEDRMTFQGRRFILIARADIALETIRSRMPIQIKIGPIEQIRDLVNLQLPGIAIQPLSVAPREIPFIQNAVYFELDGSNPLWPQFQSSAAFALHVSGDYPGLTLELWAIQKGTGQ